MSHEQLPEHGLILTQDTNGFAMACIVCSTLLTANHVAVGAPQFHTLDFSSTDRFPLLPVEGRDLAYSLGSMRARGFESWAVPELGQVLRIVGLHGMQHIPFEITVRVNTIYPDGRIVVDRLSGAQAEVGMSGSPALTDSNEVVGILVGGVDGTKRQQLYLESVQACLR